MTMSRLDGFQVLKSAHDDSNPSLRVQPINAMIPVAFDYIAITYPIDTQEVYVFKTGGSGGTTVGTITINYVDSTKALVSNVAKT